jgi:gliding motility-associated-like protein
LEATTAEGCKDTLCKELTIASVLEVFAPNSFTPDGDDKNDVWIPVVRGSDPKTYHLWIYDRWGVLVFESTDPDQAWTGNVLNGGYYPEGDVFVWRMELKHRGDSRFEVFEGNITMIR